MNSSYDLTEIDRELTTSALLGGGSFCGQHDQGYAINGTTYQWPRGSRIKWSMDFTNLGSLGADDMISCITKFLREEFEACCNIWHEFVSDTRVANILLTRKRLDGANGVLADMQIPVGNVSTNSTQLIGRFDDSENWGLYENPPQGAIDFERVAKHEWEHALGLGHKPPSVQKPALIAPIYSPTMRYLQNADIDELVRRYNAAQQPPIPPAAGSKPVNYSGAHEIEQDGKRWKGTTTGILQPLQ